MSISKKIVISLSFLAIVGGISIAIISVSANGKIFDSQAVAFIQNGDLSGYKTYLINQQTNKINSIDQVKFDKIKAKYEAAKPLMDLQAKYEPQLKVLASNKDEVGFVTLFKQYKEEAKPLIESRNKASYPVDKNSNSKKIYENKNDKKTNFAPTEEQKEELAKNEFQRALRDIAGGREYNLGRNFEGRGNKIPKAENQSEVEIEDYIR
jgi:hypothetical protein